MSRIVVALSGGVDSAAAAALLVENGAAVEGAYMKNWINEDNILGDCPWQQDIADARSIAEKLDIPFRVVNLMNDYRQRVVRYLIEGYETGITPNPDVMCNREMKFGVFRAWAQAEGFQSVATGHYAIKDDNTIRRGLDSNKDQSYFLALLQPEQVESALFPVGNMLKPDVRDTARRFNLPVATKKDSQGICFIGNVRMKDFLRTYVPDAPGPILTVNGKKVGQHQGLHLHTIGQRKGLGVPSNTFGEAYVVVGKRYESRELIVAFDRPDSPGLYTTSCRVINLSFTGDWRPTDAILAQPRYRCPAVATTWNWLTDDTAELNFSTPQRAITPGQICAFYDHDILRGGGVFL